MSADTKKRGLGRGLDALFRDVREEEESFARERNAPRVDDTPHKIVRGAELEPIEYKSGAEKPPASPPVTAAPPAASTAAPEKKPVGWRFMKVEKLQPGPFQPRREFNEQALEELAESIRAHGILQPLLVRPDPKSTTGMHQIIGGERRWRAAQKAQLHEVPVIVLESVTEAQAMEIGLIENLQRADLTPVEEALGFERLLGEFGHTQETLSKHLGKSRSHIANALRLLKLPQSVRDLIQKGALSAGHARAVVSADDPSTLAAMIVSRGLSVRQAEKMAKGAGLKGGGTLKKAQTKPGMIVKDVDVLSLERKMSALLGLAVLIEPEGGTTGKLVIEYATLEQLDDVLARLSTAPG